MGFRARGVRGRRKKSWLLGFILMATAWLMVAAVHDLDQRLRPQILGMAVGLSRQMAAQAITDTMYKKLAVNRDFSHLIVIEHDAARHITSAHFNMAAAFRIESLTTVEVQNELMELRNRVVYVPALQTLGSSLFALYGPSIPVRIVPLGSVESRVVPVVRSAGINQTVHILNLDVEAQVGVIVPFVTQPITVRSTIPIAYMVLVGSVPKVVGDGLAAYREASNEGRTGTH